MLDKTKSPYTKLDHPRPGYITLDQAGSPYRSFKITPNLLREELPLQKMIGSIHIRKTLSKLLFFFLTGIHSMQG